MTALVPAQATEVTQDTRLLQVQGEPDACDVLVVAGPITFVFHVSRIFLQRRKLDSHVGVDWLATDPKLDRRSVGMPLASFSPLNLDWRSPSSMNTYRLQVQGFYEQDTRNPRFPWAQMMQYVAQRVNEFVFSPGEFEVADHVEVKAPDYLVKPIWPDRGVTIWFGQGEAGKGYMAVGAATALMYEERFASLTTKRGIRNMYYVDYEEPDKEEFDIRVSRIANAQGRHAAPIKRYNPRGRLFSDIADALKAKMQADGATSQNARLIIDSALPAVGGQAIDPEPVGAFFSAIHYLALPTLLIAHDTKTGNEEAPFGSVFWRNLARMCVNFQASEEPMRDTQGNYVRDILLRCTKANNVPRFSPLAFQLVFSDDDASGSSPLFTVARPLASTWIRQIDPTTVSAELQKKLGPLRQIVAYFKGSSGDLTLKEIAAGTGIDSNIVYKLMTRNPGTFASEGGGRGKGNAATWRVIEGGANG